MPDVEILDKTEIWVTGVSLDRADLRQLATAAADVLGLRRDLVFVTDVRDGHVVFDVLQPRARLSAILAKQDELLSSLADVPGTNVAPQAAVHSRGVFGYIGASPDIADRVLKTATRMDESLRGYVSTRVAVVSTGAEVLAKNVTDTNVVAVAETLGAAGFEVTAAGTVDDNEDAILGRVLRLASEGYGLILTTGGVGAEDKDHTIEALQRADPALATAILASYTVGHGRHVKPHVRVAVGTIDWTRIIALPGPNHEVRAAIPVIVAGLQRGCTNSELAEDIARELRTILQRTHDTSTTSTDEV